MGGRTARLWMWVFTISNRNFPCEFGLTQILQWWSVLWGIWGKYWTPQFTRVVLLPALSSLSYQVKTVPHPWVILPHILIFYLSYSPCLSFSLIPKSLVHYFPVLQLWSWGFNSCPCYKSRPWIPPIPQVKYVCDECSILSGRAEAKCTQKGLTEITSWLPDSAPSCDREF